MTPPEVSSLADEVRRLSALLEKLVHAAGLPQEIYSNRLYEPEEAAHLLGIRSVRAGKTIAAMPDLPKVRVGPAGRLVRYRGSDLLELIAKRTEG
jgi:hypothetical protein